METYAAVLNVMIYISAIILFFKLLALPLKIGFKILFNSIGGAALLIISNILLNYVSTFSLPINCGTALIAGVAGIPGVVGLILYYIICLI